MIIEIGKDTFFVPNKKGIEKTTASGFYVIKKYATEFYDKEGRLRAALIHNKHGENFFVSAGGAGGKKYFMPGLSDLSASFLGIDDLSYLDRCDLADRIYNTIKN